MRKKFNNMKAVLSKKKTSLLKAKPARSKGRSVKEAKELKPVRDA